RRSASSGPAHGLASARWSRSPPTTAPARRMGRCTGEDDGMTISLDVPEGVLRELDMSPRELDQEVRLMCAARLYQKGVASTGRAAESLGVPRTLLLTRMASFGVTLYDVPPDELAEDAERASSGRQ